MKKNDRFFINMAIVKIDYDNHRDILDNYMPLVFESLSNMKEDTLSIEEFKENFIKLSEFSIPTSAAISLLQRASKKHGVLEKSPDKTYKIKRDILSKNNNKYSDIKSKEQRKYNRLAKKFIEYCGKIHNIIESVEDTSKYFFEILYDISPQLIKNINMNEYDIERGDINIRSNRNKYLIHSFINYSNRFDQESFESILSFVRGAMLTETFYYSDHPTDIPNRHFKNVQVFFDTQFLIQLLGFAPIEQRIPCNELMDMLKETKVSTCCFDITLKELRGILTAAKSQLEQNKELKPKRVGDLFDSINTEKITISDLQVLLNSLEEKLKESRIKIIKKNNIIEKYSIDELALENKLKEDLPGQSDQARYHDISCLQAIYQLREGIPQRYLDSCKAIFITTNSKLARLSTHFFNDPDIYGHSDAPICMNDFLFSSMVWIKSVKKSSSIPKDRLVANCYAALRPTDDMWTQYLKEAEKLKQDGKITIDDYHLLIFSNMAREKLAATVLDADENIHGDINTVMNRVKRELTEELNKKNEALQEEIDQLSIENNNRINFIVLISKKIAKLSSYLIKFIIYFSLLSLMVFGFVDQMGFLNEYLNRFPYLKILITALISIFGLVSTFFGLATIPKLEELLIKLEELVQKTIESKLRKWLSL